LSKKEKTVTRSFRVSETAFKALEEDAARRNISLNTLVNQLFLAHTNWGRYYDRVGSIKIARSTFARLLEAASDDAAIEAGRLSGLEIPRTVIIAKHGVLSKSTVLDYIRSATRYGGIAEYSEVETQGRLVITIMHNMGRKTSLFLRGFCESIFQLIDHHPKISSTDNAVLIET
jgi:hypothetical protein